jgi:hypothetical protein
MPPKVIGPGGRDVVGVESPTEKPNPGASEVVQDKGSARSIGDPRGVHEPVVIKASPDHKFDRSRRHSDEEDQEEWKREGVMDECVFISLLIEAFHQRSVCKYKSDRYAVWKSGLNLPVSIRRSTSRDAGRQLTGVRDK